MLGDFNATPWTYTLARLTERMGLRNARQGYGIQPSWPARIPILWMPLDHVLVSPGLDVIDHGIGAGLGSSDHYPVRVLLSRPR